MKREMRADLLLVENIRTLLAVRRIDDSALAIWCGHKAAWISKILSGERGMPVKEIGKVADFFGLTVCELFSPGISPLTERRKRQRRGTVDRRHGGERRVPREEQRPIHPDVSPFPPRQKKRKTQPPDGSSIRMRLEDGDYEEA